METDYVQLDPDRPTGQINVSFEAGEPSYEICAPAAWDAMQLDGRWAALAKSCAGVSFGTLAQRSAVSREAIWRFLTTANSAVRLLDVNLREDFYTPTILEQSLHLANAVKLNEQELGTIGPLLKVPLAANLVADRACEALLENYQLRFVALTRGSRGTVLYRPGQRIESPPVSYPPAADADPVGAGDAASAGLLVGSILDWPLEQTLELANHLGAFAASVSGATPRLSERLLTMIGG
jgi:fructokinase